MNSLTCFIVLAYAIIPLTEKNIQAISSHGLMTLEGYLSNSNEITLQQAIPENAAKILLQVYCELSLFHPKFIWEFLL